MHGLISSSGLNTRPARELTHHLDVQFVFRLVQRGQRLQEGKHDRLAVGPAADQQANLYALLVPDSPQLSVNVSPIPAGGAARREGRLQRQDLNNDNINMPEIFNLK